MKLTAKSQVTIPKKVRAIIGIGPGSEVEFEVRTGNVVVLTRKKGSFERWIEHSGKSSAVKIDRSVRSMRGRR